MTATASDRLELAVFRLVFGLLASLPRRLTLRIGSALGTLLYVLDRSHRRIALRNLSLAFPEMGEAERKAVLRRSCRNLGRLGAEVCHLDNLTPASIGSYVRIEDESAWKRSLALAEQRGAIILTAHLGNWELLAYAHALLGHPVTLVHRAFRNRAVDSLVQAMRERPGTRSIAKKSAAREILRALRRKELVAIPADQNQTRRYGVFADFFGIPASTTSGPARLAALTGAPVVPVFLLREGESERHGVVVLPEIAMAVTGDRRADIIENTRRCNAVIERMIREHPDQWIWFHKRWRTRPKGEPRIY